MMHIQTEQVTVVLDQDYLDNNLFVSHENDLRPADLTIKFDKACLTEATVIFKQCKLVVSLRFKANIDCESFEGKLRGDSIQINRYAVYARFINDWTNTVYEIDIMPKLVENDVIATWPLEDLSLNW